MKPSDLRILEHHISFFCNPECEHLNIKETEENIQRKSHFCKKYKQQLKHEFYHPHLVKLSWCIYNQFEDIKKISLKRDIIGL